MVSFKWMFHCTAAAVTCVRRPWHARTTAVAPVVWRLSHDDLCIVNVLIFLRKSFDITVKIWRYYKGNPAALRHRTENGSALRALSVQAKGGCIAGRECGLETYFRKVDNGTAWLWSSR